MAKPVFVGVYLGTDHGTHLGTDATFSRVENRLHPEQHIAANQP